MRFPSVRAAVSAALVAVPVAVVTALVSVSMASSAPALDGPLVAGAQGDCRSIAADSRSVTVIGDSLTLLSIEQVKASFQAAGRPLCFNAQSGRRSDEAALVVKQLRDTGQLGRTVVLALGTNDTALGNLALNQAYRLMVTSTDPRHTTFAVGWRGTDPKNSARVQLLMTQWDTAYARVHSVRWGDVVTLHPEYVGADKIHPTQAGQKAYAAFLLAAARAR